MYICIYFEMKTHSYISSWPPRVLLCFVCFGSFCFASLLLCFAYAYIHTELRLLTHRYVYLHILAHISLPRLALLRLCLASFFVPVSQVWIASFLSHLYFSCLRTFTHCFAWFVLFRVVVLRFCFASFFSIRCQPKGVGGR